jgi:hypothetical protein
MNLRAVLAEHPRRIALVAGSLLLISAAVAGLQFNRSGTGGSGRVKAFFSFDDGKSWFADDASKLPPFEKDGKQAVLAHVYRASNGTVFVNHLERFKPDAKRALESARNADSTKADTSQDAGADRSAVQSAYIAGREVKRPGDAKWVSSANVREAAQVMAIKAPDGRADAVPVEP